MDPGQRVAVDLNEMKPADDTISAADSALGARQELLRLRLQRRSMAPSNALITRRPDSVPSRISFAQEGLWFLDRMDGANGVYNGVYALRLTGQLNTARLERSFFALVERHESLRSAFEQREDGVVQVVKPMQEVASFLRLQADGLDHGIPDQQESRIRDWIRAGATEPFDLSCAPLMRLRLLQLSKSEHVLLIVVHHIVFDGWSVRVLKRELSTLYGSEEDVPILPVLPIQYADYALWQRGPFQSETLQRQLKYWRVQLDGLESLELPTDRSRPAQITYRGANESFTLPTPLLNRLKILAQSENASLFMVLLAVFQVLLMRHSRQNDVTVGIPVAGRNRPELEELIGYFVNTLVMRANLSGNPVFLEHLSQVRQTALDAYAHQDVPFDQLVAALSPKRDLSRHPLYQVSFALNNQPTSELVLPDVLVQTIELPHSTAKFDLSLALAEENGVLRGVLEYSTDLFDNSSIVRLAEQYLNLLDAVVSDPTQRVDHLVLLSETEKARILTHWNQTSFVFPEYSGVHQLVESQARRNPLAVAVIFEGQSLSYEELNANANRLAHYLRGLGVRPEMPVGLCIERSLPMLIAVLGILKSGGTYVPLDPDYPTERLSFILSDCAASILITQRTLRDRLEKTLPAKSRILCLDDADDAISMLPAHDPEPATRPQHLAYVIYTSGSTGQPKGVQIEHRSIANHLQWLTGVVQVNPTDRFLLKTSISFDASVVELLAPLVSGSCLVIAPGGGERDISALLTSIQSDAITVLQMVPSALRALLASPGNLTFKGLRYLICGGEALDRDLAREVRLRLPDVTLGNFYGPTEASIDATWNEVHSIAEGPGTMPIGRPVANAICRILDQWQQLVPVGVVGELCIGGAGLARGYLNRAELTAERFIPDPFLPGGRLYRSGDLARYLTDGNIECIGRVDDQVKLRGFRIELGEIEAALAKQEAIREAVVIVREDAPGNKRLVAYVVPKDKEFMPTAGDLRTTLGQLLPEHMIPVAFVPLAALPLTPNGKLDRKALPVPSREIEGAELVAPKNLIEQAVADIWCELLHLDKVGIHENFFELGGHSLLAAQSIARLRNLLNVEVSLRGFFDAPTVSGIAAEAEKILRAGELTKTISPITPIARDGEIQLSFAQQRLWFIDRFLPGQATYNIPAAWRIDGLLDVPALQHSLDKLVDRHETLRTHLAVIEGEPVQVITSPHVIALQFTDLSGLDPSEREARASRIADAEVCKPFNLETGPVFRVQLLRLSANEHLLLLNVHHIASDGWSSELFHRELTIAYREFSLGRDPQLPRLPVQYADYAAWQRKQLVGKELDRQLGYWNVQLAGLPILELPTDHVRPSAQSYRGRRLPFNISAVLVQGLKAMGRIKGATLHMTLLAAFQVLMARYSGQKDIAVGTPIAGRTRTELEGLIGFFVNTLVLRSDLSGNPCFLELLAMVRESSLKAYVYQDVPFERLVEELNPVRDPSRSPLIQVMFALHAAPETALALEGLEVSRMQLQSHSSKFDLTLTLVDGPAGLQGEIEYATDLFDAHSIERMAMHFTVLIEGIVAKPESPVTQLPLLPAIERHQLAVEWNSTALDIPLGCCVHRLFEEQTVRTPHSVALVFENQELSYSKLDALSNQLAHALRARGVARGERVGLCVTRGVDMVVSLLAVLKAGGTYVPLDPGFPQTRLAYYAEDAQLILLVTETFATAAPRAWRADAGSRTLYIDADTSWRRESEVPLTLSDQDSSDQDSVYVIYTSGSTGLPKGVCVQHSAVVNFLMSMQREPGIKAQDRLAAVTTLSFDIAVLELLLPLCVGAQVVIVPRNTAMDADQLRILLDKSGATMMQATPGTWRMLLDTGWRGGDTFKALVGGETCPADLAYALLGRVGELWNMYGPTETTVWSSVWRVDSDVVAQRGMSIGKPIANTKIWILDDEFQLCPLGVPGEICIGGAGVALGYLDRPELTAERFRIDSISGIDGAMLYRTGDRGRWRNDGLLEHMGRLDFQVKVRGYRIELGEIENNLLEHPEVRRTVVIVREDRPGDIRLVAYVVPHGEMPEQSSIREHLRSRLPDYMVPQHFVRIASLPLLPNGKLDRKSLPAPDLTFTAKAIDSTFSPFEAKLQSIWCEELGRTSIGVDDDFFALGGHSLLAARVVYRITREMQLPCTLPMLFREPTIRRLGKVLGEGQLAEGAEVLALQPNGLGPALFCICGVHIYQGLADRLAADQVPVYGIFLPYEQALLGSAVSGKAILPSVEEMAADYIGAMRIQQPKGPYMLAGLSFGGVLAYEMAQQLTRSGEQVVFIAILDTYLPGSIRRNWLRWAVEQLRQIRSRGARALAEKLHFWLQLKRINSMSTTTSQSDSIENELLRVERARQDIYLRATRAYSPEPYAGSTILVRAEITHLPPSDSVNPSHRWDEFIDNLQICDVPGDHLGILQSPNVDILARRVSPFIESARQYSQMHSANEF